MALLLLGKVILKDNKFNAKHSKSKENIDFYDFILFIIYKLKYGVYIYRQFKPKFSVKNTKRICV